MTLQNAEPQALTDSGLKRYQGRVWRRAGATAWAAALTMALSMPQGLLAAPVAVARVGIGPGLAILLLVGALNVLAVAGVARHSAAFYARRGRVPSLTGLAREHLGRRGQLLALAGGAALFFLALVASMVGLARSLADLTGLSAPALGLIGGLALLGLTLGGATLSGRPVIGLGLLNLGLLVALVGLLLPRAQALAAPAGGGSPLMMLGVSQMLFFAPMLVAPAARCVLPRGGDPRSLVWGSAAGVAASAGLFALWAVAVCGAVGAPALVAAAGTAIPALSAAAPAARVPATLLGLLMLGLTALRCALMLRALAEEQLAPRLAPRPRRLAAQLPAGLALTVASGLLLAGATSFTALIAAGGFVAASVVGLAVPALIALAARRPS